jgi:hypothetical protein
VEDPGHLHGTAAGRGGCGCHSKEGAGDWSVFAKKWETNTSKTGISIENLPTKSAVSISVDANDAGEHLPLVYVLICQKVA